MLRRLRQEILPAPRASGGATARSTAYNFGALAILGGAAAAAAGAAVYLVADSPESKHSGADFMKYGSVAALTGFALSLYGFGAG